MRQLIFLISAIVLLSMKVETLYAQTGEDILRKGYEQLNGGNTEKALELAETGHRISLENEDSVSRSLALNLWAQCLIYLGNVSESEEKYKECVELSAQVGPDSIWAISSMSLAVIYSMTDRGSNAIELLSPMVGSPRLTPSNKYNVYAALASALLAKGKFDSCRVFLDSLKELLPHATDEINEISYYRQEMNYHSAKQNYGEALDNALIAREKLLIAIEQKKPRANKSVLAAVSAEMGRLYSNLGQQKEALKYILEALDYAEELGLSYTKQLCNATKALILLKQGKYQEAIPLFESTREYFITTKRNENQFMVSSNLCRTYLLTGDQQNANRYFVEAEKLIKEVDNLGYKVKWAFLQFDYYFKQNKFQKCNAILTVLENKIFPEGALVHQLQFRNRKAKLCESQGQYKQCVQELKLAQQLRDTFFNLQETRIVNEMQNKYDKVKNEQEIKLLAFNNEQQETEIKKARRSAGLAVLVSLFFAGLLFTIYRQNQKIRNQNTIISKALEEKETLMREIHHRVKNNLQVISSLFHLQSAYVKDEAALATLQEGRNRVRSMSLIHQNLYLNTDLVGVNARTYFEKLIGSLFQSYRIDRDRISVSTKIDNVELDVDTLVPVALIINELLSNSLKHAFPENRKGSIHFAFTQTGKELNIDYQDDGIGLKTEWTGEEAGTFGAKLIDMFVRKLNGKMQVDGKQGFTFKMTFNPIKHA